MGNLSEKRAEKVADAKEGKSLYAEWQKLSGKQKTEFWRKHKGKMQAYAAEAEKEKNPPGACGKKAAK